MRTYPCIFHIVSRVKTTNALQSSTPHAAHDEKIIWRRMKSFSAEQKNRSQEIKTRLLQPSSPPNKQQKRDVPTLRSTSSLLIKSNAYEYLSICPGRSTVVRVIPFNLHNLATVVPHFEAITERFSPDFTRCTLERGLAVGFGRTFVSFFANSDFPLLERKM